MLPNGDREIVYDKLAHLATHLGAAVGDVRREEDPLLSRMGDDNPVDARYSCPCHLDNPPGNR